jgi:hypothetical protein
MNIGNWQNLRIDSGQTTGTHAGTDAAPKDLTELVTLDGSLDDSPVQIAIVSQTSTPRYIYPARAVLVNGQPLERQSWAALGQALFALSLQGPPGDAGAFAAQVGAGMLRFSNQA